MSYYPQKRLTPLAPLSKSEHIITDGESDFLFQRSSGAAQCATAEYWLERAGLRCNGRNETGFCQVPVEAYIKMKMEFNVIK